MCHASSCDFLDTPLVPTQRSALVRKEVTLPNPRDHERKTPMFWHLIVGLLRDGHSGHGSELMTEYASRSGKRRSRTLWDRELWHGGLGMSRSRLKDAKRTQSFAIVSAASDEFANKRFDPFSPFLFPFSVARSCEVEFKSAYAG